MGDSLAKGVEKETKKEKALNSLHNLEDSV